MRKTLTSLALAVLLGITVWSCSDDDSNPTAPPTNNAPVISELISTAVQVAPGGTSDLYCNATDEDGDALSYNWTCTSGTFSGIMTAQKTWTAPAEVGIYTITVYVSDGPSSDNERVNIEVTATPTNPPVIISLTATDYSIEPSTTTNLICNATDADGDVLTYEWTSIGGSIYGANQFAQWTAPAAEGSYIVTCKVSDPTVRTSVEKSVTIVVAENVAPVISSLTADPSSVVSGGSTEITCTATDANGDDLTYTWTKTGGILSSTTGSSVTWTAPNNVSTHTITCTVSDGEFSDAELIQINVTSPDPGSVWRVVSEIYTDYLYPEWNSTATYNYDSYNRIVSREAVGEQRSSYLHYANTTTKKPYRMTEPVTTPPAKQETLSYEILLEYDTGGKPTKITEIEYDDYGNEEWKGVADCLYSGELMTQTQFSEYEYGTLVGQEEETFTYLNGKLDEVFFDDFAKFKVIYSGNLAIKMITSYTEDGGNTWLNYETSDYSYVNNLIASEHTYGGFSEYNYWEDSTKYAYSGDKLIENINLQNNASVWIKNEKATFGYDTYGNLSDEFFYEWDDVSSSFDPEEEYQYAYQAGTGNLSEIMECFEPWYYYTGGLYKMIDPMPIPSKEGDGTFIKKLVNTRPLKDRINYLKSRRPSK